MYRLLLRTHNQLITVSNGIYRRVLDYASQMFLNPGKRLDTYAYICKRAFFVTWR